MKNIILFLLISVSLFGQRKPSDVVDVNNFDYVFAEKLLHDKFVTELSKMYNDTMSLIKDSIAYKTIDYQVSNLKNSGEFSHDNNKKFRDTLLKRPCDRFLFFYNKSITNKALSCSEVLCRFTRNFEIKDTTKKQYYILDSAYLKLFNYYSFVKTEKLDDNRKYYTYDPKLNVYTYSDETNILYNTNITYDYIVNEIYVQFMSSHQHKVFIVSAYKRNEKGNWSVKLEGHRNKIKVWAGAFFYEI